MNKTDDEGERMKEEAQGTSDSSFIFHPSSLIPARWDHTTQTFKGDRDDPTVLGPLADTDEREQLDDGKMKDEG